MLVADAARVLRLGRVACVTVAQLAGRHGREHDAVETVAKRARADLGVVQRRVGELELLEHEPRPAFVHGRRPGLIDSQARRLQRPGRCLGLGQPLGRQPAQVHAQAAEQFLLHSLNAIVHANQHGPGRRGEARLRKHGHLDSLRVQAVDEPVVVVGMGQNQVRGRPLGPLDAGLSQDRVSRVRTVISSAAGTLTPICSSRVQPAMS